MTFSSLAKKEATNRCPSVRHHSAIFDIWVTIVALVTWRPIIDDSLLSGVGVRLAPIVNRVLQRKFHAVGVSRAVAGKAQLIALAVIIVERVWVFGF